MIRQISIILTIILSACGSKTTDEKRTQMVLNQKNPTILVKETSDNSKEQSDTKNLDIATYFVIVADTNLNYSTLYDKMFKISKDLNIPIDTMGRSFNRTKNLIALPDNDEDEIYAGDYFPRRYPSDNVSLEYLNIYKKNAKEKTIALVTGIYETEKSADSALTIISKTEKNSFKIKADIYIGCMH